MQQYNIDQNSKQDIRGDISNIFSPELSADDIKLLANMYEDIGTYKFRHTEFSVNFDHTHEANQKLLENTLDAITLLVEHKTVRNLTL
jgi:DNA-binding GntR family transcriptional regulator